MLGSISPHSEDEFRFREQIEQRHIERVDAVFLVAWVPARCAFRHFPQSICVRAGAGHSSECERCRQVLLCGRVGNKYVLTGKRSDVVPPTGRDHRCGDR
jgi:hypothetical protein